MPGKFWKRLGHCESYKFLKSTPPTELPSRIGLQTEGKLPGVEQKLSKTGTIRDKERKGPDKSRKVERKSPYVFNIF